jgi:hypothetical protein
MVAQTEVKKRLLENTPALKKPLRGREKILQEAP